MAENDTGSDSLVVYTSNLQRQDIPRNVTRKLTFTYVALTDDALILLLRRFELVDLAVSVLCNCENEKLLQNYTVLIFS